MLDGGERLPYKIAEYNSKVIQILSQKLTSEVGGRERNKSSFDIYGCRWFPRDSMQYSTYPRRESMKHSFHVPAASLGSFRGLV